MTRSAAFASAKTTIEKKIRFPVFFMWTLLPNCCLLGSELAGTLPTSTGAAWTSQSTAGVCGNCRATEADYWG